MPKRVVLFSTLSLVLALVLLANQTPALAHHGISIVFDSFAKQGLATANAVDNGDFEGCNTLFNPDACAEWEEYSNIFGTPICTGGSCGFGGGTAVPLSGDYWTWFGGCGGCGEFGSMKQTIGVPDTEVNAVPYLVFHLFNGVFTEGGTDAFSVEVNDISSWNLLEGSEGIFTQGYVRVNVSLCEYAGQTVPIKFIGTDLSGSTTNFSLDDISTELVEVEDVDCNVVDKVFFGVPLPPISPPLYVPNNGEFTIYANEPMMVYDYAAGQPVYVGGSPLYLPNDADGNGYDTYTITETIAVGNVNWYALFIGNDTWVWVPDRPIVEEDTATGGSVVAPILPVAPAPSGLPKQERR